LYWVYNISGIGNGWYGRLDILMGYSDLGVSVNTEHSISDRDVFTEINNYNSLAIK
jgi:hypothetical protein